MIGLFERLRTGGQNILKIFFLGQKKPMSFHNASHVTGDSELKQVDHNDSIRDAYYSINELREAGADLALNGTARLVGFLPLDFFERHRENEQEILRVYRSTATDLEKGAIITPAAEWLLDNHYVIEEAIQEVRRDFPQRFYRQLPTVTIDGVTIPRVIALAWLYVAHTHSTVSSESLSALVDGYQRHKALQIGELWALPSILRFVLIDNLRRISIRVDRSRQTRQKANEVVDEIIRLDGGTGTEQLLKQYENLVGDHTFATQFLYRLRSGSHTSGAALAWLEDRMHQSGTDADDVMMAEHNRLASGNVTMGNIVRSLREIDDTEWSVWFEEVSLIDKILREQSDYSTLDFGSRNSYRNQIERLARRSEFSETDVARAAIELSTQAQRTDQTSEADTNVGTYLVGDKKLELESQILYRPRFDQKVQRFVKSYNWLSIAVPVILLTTIVMVVVGYFLSKTGMPWYVITAFLLMFSLPASEGATGLFNTLVTFFVRPSRLIGYEFKEGIPLGARTLVAVPCMITSRDAVDEMVRNLEVHYLANPNGEIYFALLSDWRDADQEKLTSDMELLDYAKREVAQLNAKYDFAGRERFFLLHRRRLYNPSEGVWMGWERKRGKLHELNMLLRGDKDTTFVSGANIIPDDVRYVMTLDADTRLMRDAVTKLVGKLHHPINRPVHDEETGRVIKGYGLLQPRVTPSLTTGQDASVFQRVFSSSRGIDPYVFTVSDVYQDMAGEGTFTGKGLYDVDAFERSLKGKIEENAVLSHDLLEGSFARCALVTDVELVEDFPTRYEVEVSRQHRWARGDWQLIPYILDRTKGVTALGRWKMIDNLRRSLTPIAWFVASVLGWYFMEPFGALVWQITLIFSLFVAPTISLVNGLIPRTTDFVPKAHFYTIWSDIRAANAQVALRIVFIADTACVMADAIARSLYRLFVSGKFMLEWKTAASMQSSAQGSVFEYYKQMWYAPVIAVLCLAFAALPGDNAFLIGLPFVLLWIASPAIARSVSQSAETEDRLFVAKHVASEFTKIARRTWLYYDSFVTPEHNHLPPDNYQEVPEPVVANRTSPTNIGVYLLSVISARQFGWISFANTIDRLEQTLETVEKMEKFRGHLYNWYYTDTLQTLGARYVSAVDSGNLAGHLIAVSSACRNWAEAPSAYLQGNLDGIGDVAGILSEALEALPDDRKNLRPLHRRLEERINGFLNALASVKREHEFASIRVINLAVLARDVLKLAANLDLEIGSSQSQNVVRWAQSLVDCCEAHIADSSFDIQTIEPLRQRLTALRDRSRDLAFSMDFRFLYRKDRRLLSIGYRVDTKELDEACYDLLASECRLTSMFAIAKGDLPTEHWYRLGRQVVPVGAQGALVSWSGSMFEYLMPPLVMQERQGGILNQTNNLIVREQITHGRRLNTPWGISEAAFNARDHLMNYQYTNFGVPTLGLKRGLGQNAVIAPYASILAAQYDPESALENLERLRNLGALGQYGFYDAVDFTPTRIPESKKCAVVYNYYAHHHGMSIAAIANVVFDGALRELFHSDPVIEAAELLLQEKAPREIPVISAKYEPETPGKEQADLLRAEVRTINNPVDSYRESVFLSNGHYSTMLTATGSGYSRWNGQSISRWKADATEDRWGTFLFLRDTVSGAWWSATVEPRVAEGEIASTVFNDDKAEFQKTVGELTSVVECIVASEHDAEGRRITLLNVGSEDRYIEVTSYMEPVIAQDGDDSAHPLFSRMFIQTEMGKRGDVIRAWRNRRSQAEPETVIAHLVADGAGGGRDTQFETSREKFIGRGRSLGEAAAFDQGTSLSNSDGFTLDPVLSLRRIIRVPAGKKVSVIFWTVAAPTREELDRAIERYRHPDAFAHELIQAWTRTQVQMRHVGVTSQQAAAFQDLARYLVYPDMQLRADTETQRSGLTSQRALWPLAISGDYPIFALRINDDVDMDIVKEALIAYDYLRSRGVIFDLVIVNERAASYAQDMQHALEFVSEAQRRINPADGGRPHVFSVRRDLMDEETWNALLAASRVVLHVRNGKIVDQVVRAGYLFARARGTAVSSTSGTVLDLPAFPVAAVKETQDDLQFWNGYGGFSSEGDEYVIRLQGGQSTPHPWINVLANERFGAHISGEGAGFTWSSNSRDYQLSPWSNDPVINRPGEAIYVVDRASGKIYSPFAALSRNPQARFETRHGLGYSRFSSDEEGLQINVLQLVAPDQPVKITQVKLRNTTSRALSLKAYGYVEWVLGTNAQRTGPFIVSEFDDANGALIASNPYSIDYHERRSFLMMDGAPDAYTSSRREFIGRYGSVQKPEALLSSSELSGSLETTGDPCGALMRNIALEPGEERQFTLYLGDADNVEELQQVIAFAKSMNIDSTLDAVIGFWKSFVGNVKVETPDASLNNLVNYWLPYQALACRVMARTAFYQSSGAFGYRDQLQDTLAFVLHRPELAREQIIRAAGRQFEAGDVQHWWLPKTGAGVRTLISDDVVWLGHATYEYIEATGDRAILDEQIPFLTGPTLEDGQHDSFFQPGETEEKVSLYEHAARALDLAIQRTGENGLPLILGGDWNDGMNRVGIEGRGTSVWLGWFLAGTLRDFITVAEARGDQQRATHWASHLESLRSALETAGWDGEYYRRGYFDDGTPLGSHENVECRIDSLGQSWSVLSGEGEPNRSKQAMDAVMANLVDDENGIIRLFTPPFRNVKQDPGYIKSYPPGVRENGGQYTHAATWVVMALAKSGRSDEAWKCFSMLNPVNHALTQQSAERYRTEPYVVAADVYGAGNYSGRGGWSWYTGSAGWLYRAAVEGILGVTRKDGQLAISPSLPSEWTHYSATVMLNGEAQHIKVDRQPGSDAYVVTINGAVQ
jgi:cyclic beta-1,2-glucan synthetase